MAERQTLPDGTHATSLPMMPIQESGQSIPCEPKLLVLGPAFWTFWCCMEIIKSRRPVVLTFREAI